MYTKMGHIYFRSKEELLNPCLETLFEVLVVVLLIVLMRNLSTAHQ